MIPTLVELPMNTELPTEKEDKYMEEIITLQAELNKELASLLEKVKDSQKTASEALEAMIMLQKVEAKRKYDDMEADNHNCKLDMGGEGHCDNPIHKQI